MCTTDIFEWTFTPPDYFEAPIEINRGGFVLTIDAGRIEGKMDSLYFDEHPEIHEDLQAIIEARFNGAQIISFARYVLSGPKRTRILIDGRRDAFAMPVSVGGIALVGCPTDIVETGANGQVVRDTKAERINDKRVLGEQIEKHMPSSATLVSVTNSLISAGRDPKNELVYLYEVLDALSKEFHGKMRAIKVLGLNSARWSRLGLLCNITPLREGRHRGMSGSNLRRATQAELDEARGIAKEFLRKFINHLE